MDDHGMRAQQILGPRREALCVFEFIYFARPDSIIADHRIYPIRMKMGAELAREYPVDADVVIGVPDSATAAAIGYAQASGIPYAEGLIKNRYVNRTFIKPDQAGREAAVQLKLNAVRELLEGKRVIVVDDSIVRGTTTPTVVSLLRRSGATAVHVRILRAADPSSLLFRRRHGDADRVNRGAEGCLRNPRTYRSGLAGLPESRRLGARGQHPAAVVLAKPALRETIPSLSSSSSTSSASSARPPHFP